MARVSARVASRRRYRWLYGCELAKKLKYRMQIRHNTVLSCLQSCRDNERLFNKVYELACGVLPYNVIVVSNDEVIYYNKQNEYKRDNLQLLTSEQKRTVMGTIFNIL